MILLKKPNETATTFNTMLCRFSREGLQLKLRTIFFSVNLFPKFAWPLSYRLQEVLRVV